MAVHELPYQTLRVTSVNTDVCVCVSQSIVVCLVRIRTVGLVACRHWSACGCLTSPHGGIGSHEGGDGKCDLASVSDVGC